MLLNSKAIFVFLLWTTIALSFHYFITNSYFENCYSTSENELVITEIIQPSKLVVTNSKNDTLYSFNNSISIRKNTTELSIENTSFIDSIQHFLSNKYDLNIEITGFNATDETTTNTTRKLGILRATALKELLISKGIDSNAIVISGIEKELTFTKENVYKNAFKLQFQQKSNIEIDSIENAIAHTLLYLNFNDDNNIGNEKPLQEYSPKLKYYLQKYPLTEIIITGHTDNEGYYQNNLILGLNQAKKVKLYLENTGFANYKITTKSKGEGQPIANKYTEEGKALNRRIEITLK